MLILIRDLAAIGKAPREQFLIGATCFHSLGDRLVADAEKLRANFVETVAEIRNVVGGKFSSGV